MSQDYTNEDKVTYHSPSEEGANRHKILSSIFTKMLYDIDALMPDGREKAIAKTKLEEAKMWASAGVARNPETR